MTDDERTEEEEEEEEEGLFSFAFQNFICVVCCDEESRDFYSKKNSQERARQKSKKTRHFHKTKQADGFAPIPKITMDKF